MNEVFSLTDDVSDVAIIEIDGNIIEGSLKFKSNHFGLLQHNNKVLLLYRNNFGKYISTTDLLSVPFTDIISLINDLYTIQNFSSNGKLDQSILNLTNFRSKFIIKEHEASSEIFLSFGNFLIAFPLIYTQDFLFILKLFLSKIYMLIPSR